MLFENLRVPGEKRGTLGFGDVWTWVAIDPDTKLVVSFTLGTRGAQTAKRFMDDLASRLANRVQLTTDGHRAYLQAAARMPLEAQLTTLGWSTLWE